ncbi:Tyrosine-protein kinase RYK [Trichoplax sp. H2]|nr:Tyrosine-protein kinase RYK [Trichoplax sp. H2]|eukprot:RDD46705.1 Tyrosine-protein kinase RYK [Trichoplax sp. H2]
MAIYKIIFLQWLLFISVHSLDVYLSANTTHHLYGVSSYLFYIKDDQRQQQAINFISSVPHQIDRLSFRYHDPEKNISNRIETQSNDSSLVTISAGDSNSIVCHFDNTCDLTVVISCSKKISGKAVISIDIKFNSYTTLAIQNLHLTFLKHCQEQDQKSPISTDGDTITISYLGLNIITAAVVTFFIALLSISITINVQSAIRDHSYSHYSRHEQRNGEVDLPKEAFIKRKQFDIKSVLMTGKFSGVYNGILKTDTCETKPIFIKALEITKNTNASPERKHEKKFLEEGAKTYGLKDSNILAILGICVDDKHHKYCLYDGKNLRNLKSYLRGRTKAVTTLKLLEMAEQIAQGIRHLAIRGIIHKDVAVRNCWLVSTTNCKVKLGDKALADCLFSDDYVSVSQDRILPIRWMSVESLTSYKFDKNSDMWSFGVVMWELMTLCQTTPYKSVEDNDLCTHLRSGYRLERPPNCPEELYSIMLRCWTTPAKRRPSLSAIIEGIEKLGRLLKQYI